GLLWNKQLYAYDVPQWLRGDPGQPAAPPERRSGRNSGWRHLANFDVLSMPDKCEYPWFAAWDLAFHCLPLALLDPAYAKRQLELLSRAWYMHPNGQFPAYEWKFDDVNPPVQAWAAWRVYKIEAKHHGQRDRVFLEGMFHKLLLNFTWWVNRKDNDGNNIFQGGFLGLDNISVIDRSALPVHGRLDQSDATSWMAAYCLNMLRIALELAKDEPIYQDTATKFFEHFLRIANAMSSEGHHGLSLWDDDDGFFYDALHTPDAGTQRLRVRSLVGLLPIFASEVLEPGLMERLPVFSRRVAWFTSNRPRIAASLMTGQQPGREGRRLLALLSPDRLRRVLARMLDEGEFLSPHGIRSLSKYHQAHPYHLALDGNLRSIRYEPAESTSGLYGGNSNWRGPVWFPINFLMIEALERLHHFYGSAFTVECPTGSERQMTLKQVAAELARRLSSLFLRNEAGERPCCGGETLFQHDPHFRDYLRFNEYFHGDNGAGLGASQQTGWTALVASLLQKYPG
ncbi:MAG: MGH1-like glycoside hydrolase domain-containing protein, partial [Longimicrobiales bacterium]